jgi:hypothetical protein
MVPTQTCPDTGHCPANVLTASDPASAPERLRVPEYAGNRPTLS